MLSGSLEFQFRSDVVAKSYSPDRVTLTINRTRHNICIYFFLQTRKRKYFQMLINTIGCNHKPSAFEASSQHF